MATPIIDFVENCCNSKVSRFFMPGHKGKSLLGFEQRDITEIKGADYLYEASGIIGESERQTAAAFGAADTLFSTEGSTLCIKTMLGIIRLMAGDTQPTILAPRNVHKAFIDGCILLDINVVWLYPQLYSESICSANITPQLIENALKAHPEVTCCYVTSPDYLGNTSDIQAIAKICHSFDKPLLVDNAHGAYLAFLEENAHPIPLGADMCCDSAHKTLPCCTGTAYLHISKTAPQLFSKAARNVMSMFASTSPSYLLLQSLDLCGDMLASGEFAQRLAELVKRVDKCRQKLTSLGWALCGNEKTKLTICAAKCGHSGTELAELLRQYSIEPEYSDREYVVLMAGVYNTESDFERLENALAAISIKPPLINSFPPVVPAERKMSMRDAAFLPWESVNVDDSLGRVCAMTVTACQPSVPVVVSGEVISEDIIKIMKKYSIFQVNVL